MKKSPNKVIEKRISKNQISKIMILKTIIYFVIIFTIIAGIRYAIAQNDINTTKNNAEYTASNAFDKISVKIEIIEEELNSMTRFVIDSKGNVADFDQAAAIVNDYNISCIMLAPHGVVQYVYPSAGNEYLMGYNYWDFSNNFSKIGSITVEADKNISGLSGPYLYRNGKTYLLVKVPIFLKNNLSESWGFACALINFPNVIQNSGIDIISTQKYKYKLFRYDDNNQEKVILSSYKNDIHNGITVQRQILNQTWNIMIEPEEGWYNKNEFLFEGIIITIISLLISIIIFDYLRLKHTSKILTKIVNVDTLTGAFSRKYFFDYAETEIQRNKRFGICYIDVDRFKPVNDTYGHEVGDKFLMEVTNRIRECIRKNDFVSRIGGDEFVIFMNDINEEFDGEAILKRFKTSMEEPFIIKNNIILQNTLSIGYSVFPEDGSTVEELIQKADYYMYHMKKNTHRENHINHLIKQNKINYLKKNDNK